MAYQRCTCGPGVSLGWLAAIVCPCGLALSRLERRQRCNAPRCPADPKDRPGIARLDTCAMRRILRCVLILVGLFPVVAHAQDIPVKQSNWRYDEDWSVLRDCDPARLPDWAALKYRPLTRDGGIWISTGVEARVRYEGYENNEWGSAAKPNDGPLWFRLMPHVDVHAGPVRAFAQGIIGVPITMEGRPGPADRTGIDLLQGFGEATLPVGSGEILLRGGRELVALGTERLLGTRYGPNIPQPFDGVRVIGDWGGLHVQLFDLRPVNIGSQSFDDRTSNTRSLKGAYLTYERDSLGLDAYLLDYRNANAHFNQGTGAEHRQTYGVRFFGSVERLSWNWEAMFQTGHFGDSEIEAWSVGTETNYKLSPVTFRLRADVISGDQSTSDRKLGTFNPLFPKGKYFGELSPVGPYNIINLQPALDMDFGHGLTLGLAAEAYWRASTGDGIYGMPGNLLRASQGSNARYIGHQEEIVIGWQPTSLLSFTASYSRFTPGAFVRATGAAKTIHMAGLEAMFRL